MTVLREDGKRARCRCDGCGVEFWRTLSSAYYSKRDFHDRPCYRAWARRNSKLSPDRLEQMRRHYHANPRRLRGRHEKAPA